MEISDFFSAAAPGEPRGPRGAKLKQHRLGIALVPIGVEGHQRSATVEIELTKPNPTSP